MIYLKSSNRPTPLLSRALLLLCVIGTIWPGRSATYTATWLGVTDGDWHDPANWSTGLEPNNGGGDVHHVVWTSHPVTVRITNAITVESFTFQSGGRLENDRSLTVQGTFTWTAGTLAGTGATILEGESHFYAAPLAQIGLEENRLYVKGAATLRSPLSLANPPLFLPQIHVAASAHFEVKEDGAFAVTGGLAPTLQNFGTLRFQASSGETICGVSIENNHLVHIENRTLKLSAPFYQNAGVLRLQDASLPLYPTEAPASWLSIQGGAMEGTGHIGSATINGLVAPATLTGRIRFNTLQLLEGTMLVTLGGRLPGEFSHFSVSDHLYLGGRLNVQFANGFESAVMTSDVFEFLTPGPDCRVVTESPPSSAPFLNVAYGERIISEGYRGALTLDRASPANEALVLKEFGLVPFTLSFNPARNNPVPSTSVAIFPIPSTRFGLDFLAELENPGGTSWNLGYFELAIMGGLIAARDSLQVQSIGTASGQISVAGTEVKYGGIALGTLVSSATPSTLTLRCTFNASATTEGIQAALRQLTYNVSYIWADEFNDVAVRLPSRELRLTLVNSVGQAAVIPFTVEFPHVEDIVCRPPAVALRGQVPWNEQLVYVLGRFSNREQVSLPNLHIYYRLEPYDSASWSGPEPRTTEWNLDFGRTLSGDFRARCARFSREATHFVRFSVLPDFTPDQPFNRSLRIDVMDSSGGASSRCFYEFIRDWYLFIEEGEPLFGPAAEGLRPAAAQPSGELQLGSFHALEILMRQTAEGQRLADLYRQHSPELVAMAMTNGQLVTRALAVITEFQPAVQAFLAGRGSDAIITSGMIDRLNQVWTNVSRTASPAMRATMETERARFNNFQTFVGGNLNQWAAQLQLTLPTQPFFILRRVHYGSDSFYVHIDFNEVEGWTPLLWSAPSVTGPWQPRLDVSPEPIGYGQARFIDRSSPPDNESAAGRRFYRISAAPSP